MNTDHIDSLLADFRDWLAEAPQPEEAAPAPESVDLFTLLAQFTALRHDVTLQTKAARSTLDQNAEVLQRLTEATKPADPTAVQRPLVKALIDIADALTTAVKQLEKSKGRFEPLLEKTNDDSLLLHPATTRQPGFFARLFGATDEPRWEAWARQAEAERKANDARWARLRETLLPLVAGITDGYVLSLRRLERALQQCGVTAIECEGMPFDPELMEAIEAVGDTGRATGTVIEEVRRGYRWHGALFRFAQVKVAR